MIGELARIAEPNAALGFNLLQIRAPIGRKDEGHQEGAFVCLDPRPADSLGAAIEPKSTRVSLRLIDVSRDILVLAFGLNDRDATGPDEQRIVGRAALGRPLRDRQVAPFRGSDAGAIAKRWSIGIPTSRPKMGIDQGARRRLVDIDLGGSRFCLRDDGGRGLRRRSCSCGL